MRPAGEQLTALGTHVASMPMDPRLAKALIYACMLR
jgi:HrpA-like RNA helicase